MRSARFGRELLAAAVTLAVVAAPSVAAAAPPISLETAKHRDGPYHYIEPTKVSVGNRARDVFLRVTSNGGEHAVQLFDERCCDGKRDYRVRYFRGRHNITHDARSPGGFSFNVAFGAPKRLRIELDPKVASPDPFCVFPRAKADAMATEYHGYFAVNDQNACV